VGWVCVWWWGDAVWGVWAGWLACAVLGLGGLLDGLCGLCGLLCGCGGLLCGCGGLLCGLLCGCGGLHVAAVCLWLWWAACGCCVPVAWVVVQSAGACCVPVAWVIVTWLGPALSLGAWGLGGLGHLPDVTSTVWLTRNSHRSK
jgi:hypothetical protein